MWEHQDHEPIYGDEPVSDPDPYRSTFLGHLMNALNHPNHPASAVTSLAVWNLHSFVEVRVATSNDFKAVLSRLSRLDLFIATNVEEEPYRSGPYEINEYEPHAFFTRDLLEYWLKPVQDNIVHLKLESTCYWGYIPKCDLRVLRCPKLKSLSLSRMTFTHDWQRDWIASHGDTLTQLTLYDCPIVNDIWIGHTLDHERYPVFTVGQRLDWEDEGPDYATYWSYDTRWHDYFKSFRAKLPHLRTFWIGYAADFDSYYYRPNQKFGRALAEAADSGTLASNYGAFSHNNCRSPWVTDHYESHSKLDGDLDPARSYPTCQEEDQKALDELLDVVRGRVR